MRHTYKLWILANYGEDEVYDEAENNVTFAKAIKDAVTIITSDDTLKEGCCAHILREFDENDTFGFVKAVAKTNGSDVYDHGYVDYMFSIEKNGMISGTYLCAFDTMISADEVVAIHELDNLEFLQFSEKPRNILASVIEKHRLG